MSITEFSLKTNRVTVLLIVMILIVGVLEYIDYPKQEDPTVTIREAVVTAHFPGMSPLRIEDLITRKLEEKIREIGEVDEIKSDSKTGLSIIHVVVKDAVRSDELTAVWQELRNKMDDVVPDLPEGTVGPFVDDEFGLTAVATIALWADGFDMAEMRDVARDARDRLYTVDGIRRVELFGIQEERVYLELQNAKMSQLGLSPDVIVGTMQDQNIILPGGDINVSGQSVIVEPSGNFNDVEEIRSVVIPIPDTERTIPLLDIVRVVRTLQDPSDDPVFFRGKQAIVLSISILEGVNAVDFGDRLTAEIERIETGLPWGYVLEYATYQPDLVTANVNGALGNLAQTLIIVLVVVIVFLGLRTGLIVGSFVPIAMIMGLVIMSIFEVEFQRMSIAAMIIALGMLVDNGIVMAEDIRTRTDNGWEPRKAAIHAGRILMVPLLTSSLTTILFFGPLVLMEGNAGEYTGSLGQVLIIVLLSSWFLAMYMTPVMCVAFLKPKDGVASAQTSGSAYDSRPYQVYRAFPDLILRMRFGVIVVLVAALVGAGFLARTIAQEFFPTNDRAQFLVYVDLPAGSHINQTIETTQTFVAWLEDSELNPEVTGTIAYIGNGGPRFFLSLSPSDPDPHRAFIVVNLAQSEQVAPMVRRVNEYALTALPNARVSAKAMWFGPTETGLFEVRLYGPDLDGLREKAEPLKAALRAIPGTVDIKHDWDNEVLTVEVLVDQNRARRAGITSQQVASSLNAYIDGAQITSFREGDKVIPVVIRAVASERDRLAQIRAINVYSTTHGTNVPLSQIADFRGRWDPSVIKRFDQERTITVSARHQVDTAATLFSELEPAIASLDLGSDYRWEMGGELEASAESDERLSKNLPLCLMLVVFLLIWQFNSFRRMTIIMLTIPLSFIGGILGMVVFQTPLGFMPILGFLSLAGIIINNGIVLIDRIDIERADGEEPYEAIVAAALARARPIIMTTVTTLLGLTPLIVWKDPLFFGMAAVISMGLLIGTILTLGVVPILYSLFFGIVPPNPAKAE